MGLQIQVIHHLRLWFPHMARVSRFRSQSRSRSRSPCWHGVSDALLKKTYLRHAPVRHSFSTQHAAARCTRSAVVVSLPAQPSAAGAPSVAAIAIFSHTATSFSRRSVTWSVCLAIACDPLPLRPGDGATRKVKAICNYCPLTDEELKLEVNDVIEVISYEEGGLCRGRLNGKVGIFPADCTKPIDSGMTPLAKSGMTLDGTSDNATTSEIQPKKIHGVGFGNIFVKDAKIELKSKNMFDCSPKSIERFSPKLSPGPGSAKSEPSARDSLPKEVPKEYVKVEFAYDAENDDELTLKEGDIITVISKECEDSGWWYGELNGKLGVFPDNFVLPVPAEEVEKKAPHLYPPLVPAKPLKASTTASAQGQTTPADTTKFLKSPVLQDVGAGSRHSSSTKHSSSVMTTNAVVGAVEKKELSAATDTSLEADLFSPAGKKVGKASELGDANDVHDGMQPDELSTAKAFDRLSENEKLSHLTACRPRLVNRRPPSKVMINDMKEHVIEDSTYVSPTSEFAKENASSRETFVSRESFETLQAAFELFKKETNSKLKELERKICSLERKGKL